MLIAYYKLLAVTRPGFYEQLDRFSKQCLILVYQLSLSMIERCKNRACSELQRSGTFIFSSLLVSILAASSASARFVITGQPAPLCLSAGFAPQELWHVVRYLQKEVRAGRRNVGALKLSNLLQLDRFEEDLNISRVRLHAPSASVGRSSGALSDPPRRCPPLIRKLCAKKP